MKKIVVCCSQGMSSSILVRKMKEYIKEQNLDMTVKATTIERVLGKDEAFDVLWLGPQIRMEKKKLQSHFPDKIVEVIEMKSYGRLDGKKVIMQSIDLMNEK